MYKHSQLGHNILLKKQTFGAEMYLSINVNDGIVETYTLTYYIYCKYSIYNMNPISWNISMVCNNL